MTILSKYIAGEIIRYIIIVLVASVGIYVAVDFFERIDNFMEAEVPLNRAVIFFLYKIPFIIAQILPVCVLLSVLIAFGLMSRNNEILALKSSGISIWQMLKPVIGIGLLFTCLLSFLSEVVVPITVNKANLIWLKEVRKRSEVITREKDIWLKDAHMILHIRYYNKAEEAIYGISVNHFDSEFKLIKRIDAKKGIFLNGIWVLYDLMEQLLDNDTGNYNIVFHKMKTERLDIAPESLDVVVKKSEEMNFKELLEYIRKVESEGYDATVYKVDLYAKIAFPLVCLILSIIGTGIAAKGKISIGMATGIAYGIGVAFFYWVFYSFCLSLGYGEILHPLLSAWAANVVFLCFGIVNLLNVT